MNSGILTGTGEYSNVELGPGTRLRIAREQAKLSIHAVAAYLYLSVDLITEIENDDYSGGTKPVFMCGYLRAYANLLGLSGDEIVNTFNKFYVERPDPKANEIVKMHLLPSSRGSQNHRKRSWVLLLGVPTLLVLAFFVGNKVIMPYFQQTLIPQLASTVTPKAAEKKETLAQQTPVAGALSINSDPS